MADLVERRAVLKLLAATAATVATPELALAQKPLHTVVMLLPSDVPNLASYLHSATPTALVATKIYDGLLQYDFDLKPKPALAESWQVSADNRTITFKLRRDVTFHDGTRLTANDVRFSIIEVLKKYNARGPITFRDLVDIDVLDEYTAVFKLSNPAPYLLMALSGYEAPILPKHLFEGTDIRNNRHANEPIGTGPFKFVEWKRGQYILLDRNKNFWGAKQSNIDRLIARHIPDAGTRTAALEKGEVQLAGFGAVYYPDVRRLEKLPTISSTTRGYELISPVVEMHFNTRHAPFDQVKVRQAISYAMDRQFIIDNIWFGFGKKATGPLSSNFAASGLYTRDVHNYDVPDRNEVAKRLLDEAGFPLKAEGFRFEMNIDPLPFGEEWRRFAEYVQQALGQVGIKATVRSEDFSRWLRRIYTDYDFDLALTWVSNLADPVIGTHREFHSNSIRKGAFFSNASGWSSPETDSLLDRATVEPDPDKRAELYHRFQQLLVEAVPTVWILELLYSTVYYSKLKNVVVGPLGLYQNLAEMHFS